MHPGQKKTTSRYYALVVNPGKSNALRKLPDREFLVSIATSTAASKGESDQGVFAVRACRPGCLVSDAAQNRRVRSATDTRACALQALVGNTSLYAPFLAYYGFRNTAVFAASHCCDKTHSSPVFHAAS